MIVLVMAFSQHSPSPLEKPDLPQYCRNPAMPPRLYSNGPAMRFKHACLDILSATFCAVGDHDFSRVRAYIQYIAQPRQVASGFKDQVHAVYLQQAEFRSDRLEWPSPQKRIPRAQRRHGRAARPARRHPHPQRRLIPSSHRQVRPHPAPPSPEGGVFLLPSNGESRASRKDARLAKIRMAASTKTHRSPGTPVRKTFPEQAAVSPAVTTPIAAHRYRTVIGTLSNGESRTFSGDFEKFPPSGPLAPPSIRLQGAGG
ncbi:hypothetical protein [Shinella sp.]|uniref:hypothetical protein n=1 Tax=Shinella sp. TaxID=1870904 RepID=UPI0039E3CE91